MTRLFALFGFFLLAAQPATAQVNFTSIEGAAAPEGFEKLIGDARINIYDYRFNELGSIAIANGTVKGTGTKFVENPTHKVYVREADTLNRIFDGGLKEFNLQRSVNNIRIEAQDFGGQMKLAIGTIVVSFVSLFLPP
jgi:hypothetical protein